MAKLFAGLRCVIMLATLKSVNVKGVRAVNEISVKTHVSFILYSVL